MVPGDGRKERALARRQERNYQLVLLRMNREAEQAKDRQQMLEEAKSSKFIPRDVLADPLPFGPNPPPAPSARSIEIKAAVRRYLEKTR